jgi:hypothetical protein
VLKKKAGKQLLTARWTYPKAMRQPGNNFLRERKVFTLWCTRECRGCLKDRRKESAALLL